MNLLYDVKKLTIGSLQQASVVRIGVTGLCGVEDDNEIEEVTAEGAECLLDENAAEELDLQKAQNQAGIRE